MDFRKLFQKFDHPVVVFQGMQPDPGEAVLSRNQVFVIRLMLMPENDDAQNGHGQAVS
jgi:hypothetical protein